MMDFDDFDWEDAAILGGIIGFVEESIREEERGFDDDTDDDTLEERMREAVDRDVNLLQFRRENPQLYDFILKKVIEQRIKWRRDRLKREAMKRAESEFSYELEAMAKTETLYMEALREKITESIISGLPLKIKTAIYPDHVRDHMIKPVRWLSSEKILAFFTEENIEREIFLEAIQSWEEEPSNDKR